MPEALFCEFCEISKNTFFYRTPLLAAFENTAVNTIEKACENINKTNEEDIIATIEIIEKKFEKL